VGDVEVIHGDCLSVMRGMADASVDAVVTDPPYGTGQWQRAESGAGRDPKAIHVKAEWDVWDTFWLDESLRISRGPVAFFLPNEQLLFALSYAKENKLQWRILVWCKPDPRPRFGGQTSYGFEPVIVYRGMSGNNGKDWCEASSPRKGRDADGTGHPHQKPLKAVRWLCDMVAPPGSLIFDPFAGSGTTAVACLKTGRRCIIVESDPKYIPVIKRRVAEASTPLFASEGVGL
jgi:site-specific DNA-methyltransferase (adenine-specific)